MVTFPGVEETIWTGKTDIVWFSGVKEKQRQAETQMNR